MTGTSGEESEVRGNPTYLVNEVYACLQGEGRNLGLPSVLVRFQICNLRCSWCDTPYTHTFKSDPVDAAHPGAAQKFRRLTLDALVTAIRAAAPSVGRVRHVIFSGGEPTLQNFIPVLDALGPGTEAEVETNGTRVPHVQLKGFSETDYAKVQWNVSPKGENASQRLEVDALRHWASLAHQPGQRVFFKFVLRREAFDADCREVLDLVGSLGLSPDRVLLMPEGTSADSQLGRQDLHDFCLNHGFSYTPRLHVLLFGNRRGV